MFIDSHIHITLDGINFKESRERFKKGNFKKYIHNIFKGYKEKGIYALRDGGDDLEVYKEIKEIARKENIIYKSPIYALYKKNHYASFLGRPIGNKYEFKREFEILKSKGIDHLKIPLTGLVSFKKYKDVGEIAFSLDELKYMIDSAKDSNISVMVHANSKEAVNMAIKSGANTIEHGYFIEERELYNMAKNNIIWIPTLAPFGNIYYKDNKILKKHINIIEKVYKKHLEIVNKGYELGVNIGVGSDSGAYLVRHVEGFFDEIKYLKEAGISEKEALKLSFENGIKALNLTKEEINFIRGIKNEFSRSRHKYNY
ncbi:MAG: amidohydrolase family protein [Firmicutes bacterium]|nr:amidohydrolase family protein [Bacillota bacterium]